jgi:hypothetical protein
MLIILFVECKLEIISYLGALTMSRDLGLGISGGARLRNKSAFGRRGAG